ncbi:PP0621 family protein [Helicobacter sp. MIT 05-5294]|uniref:PP0621 family protein n=1 Tax=Helicobacter sp. MIT 05-5294 TaxID=1548150 RepID=UPI00051FE306|nr:PP0621 family protein [Helicobacter sp. MIT 05-5294]TLD87854.1 hypothetical protein LS69_003440 [Helicobacter sp. MIT 05-5294]
MLKWFLLILLLVGVYLLFFRKNTPTHKNPKNPKTPQDSVMLECAQCGTYVSSEEVIIKNGKYYCSKECANLQ